MKSDVNSNTACGRSIFKIQGDTEENKTKHEGTTVEFHSELIICLVYGLDYLIDSVYYLGGSYKYLSDRNMNLQYIYTDSFY